jgi:hypothetical protein
MKANGFKSFWLLALILLPPQIWAAGAPGWWCRPLASSSATSSVVFLVARTAFLTAATALSFGANLYWLVQVIAHFGVTVSSVTLWISIAGVCFGVLIVILGYACSGIPHAWDPFSDKRSGNRGINED